MRGKALVTGASSGIGLAVATLLRQSGYDVVGTSRTPGASGGHGIPLLPLDLDDPDSVRELAARVGEVDVLVCNAGESLCGPLEDVAYEALERLFRVNVLGHALLTQQVVAGMRARRRGRIVMIGSMHASFPVAFRSGYVASKAALRGLADALRSELAPYGVAVTTVEPGSIRTGISERRSIHLAERSPYAGAFGRFLEALDGREKTGPTPDTVARVVLDAVAAARPRRLYPAAPRGRMTYALARVLPEPVMERLVLRSHGL